MSAYTDHLADRLRQSIWLVEISTTRLSDGVAVTLRYSSDRFATGPSDTPASTPYEARLVDPLSVVIEAGDVDATGGMPALRGGSVRLGARAGDLDALPGTYALHGSRVRVLLGGYTPSTSHMMTYAEYGEPGVFEIDSVEVGPDSLVLGLRDLSYRLDDRLEDRVFGGRDYAARFGSGAFTRISYGAPAKLNVTGDLTVEAWVYVAAHGAAGRLVCGWRTGTGRPWALWIGNAGEISYLDSAGSAATVATLDTHRWYHIAFVKSSAAGTVTFYWRGWGGSDHSEVVSGMTFPSPSAAGGAVVDVGHNFDGMISDVRVWTAARTAQQVRSRRTFPLAPSTEIDAATLKLYATLNESDADTSASAATASAVGTPTYLPTCDGDENTRGGCVPVVMGIVENTAPAQADSRKLVYCLSDRGSVISSITVREGGFANYAAGSSRSTLLALLETTPTAATYDWHFGVNGAYIRLGSLPSKPIGVDVTCTVTALGGVIEHLLTERGNDPYDISDVDVDLAKTPNVGYYSQGEPATLREALDYLTSGQAAYWVSRSAVVQVAALALPAGTPAAVLTEAEIIEWSELERLQPVWRYGMRGRRNWQVLEGDALAGAIVGTENEPFYRKQWRTAFRTEDQRERYPRSRPVDRESAIATYADAMSGATTRLDLFQLPSRRIRMDIVLGVLLERYGVVEISLEMPAVTYNNKRLPMSGLWVVLAIAEDNARGRQSLTLWRPEA